MNLIRSAQLFVILLGYTFDRWEIADAIIEASYRLRHLDTPERASTAIGVDKGYAMGQRCRDMMPCLRKIQQSPTVLRLLTGRSLEGEYEAVGRRGVQGNGIQHAKTLHTDQGSIVGSCNWTTSSRSNKERGLLVRFDPAWSETYRQRLTDKIYTGVPLVEAEVLQAQRRRENRSVRSLSPAGNSRRVNPAWASHALEYGYDEGGGPDPRLREDPRFGRRNG